MDFVLAQLQLIPWKQSMKKSCRANKLDVDLVTYYTPLRFRSAYIKFTSIYQKKKDENLERWLQNQLKAYYWVLVAVSCVTQRTIKQFGQSEWDILRTIFYFKNSFTLEYEAKKLIQELTNQLWVEDEEILLLSIINFNHKISNKWNELARKLYQLSKRKYLRTGKQCRERWLNHLDPAKKHGEWTEDEDIELSTLFLQYGKKWSLISKKLSSNRTEHMVKNRYKTMISKQKRLFPHLKLQTSLLKSFNESLAQNCPQQQQNGQILKPPPIQIKSEPEQNQYKIEQDINYYDDAECQQICTEMNEFENYGQKQGLNLITTYQLPPLFSPWDIDIPTSPVYSPTLPYFQKFTSTFSSFDADYMVQFQCPNRMSDQDDQL